MKNVSSRDRWSEGEGERALPLSYPLNSPNVSQCYLTSTKTLMLVLEGVEDDNMSGREQRAGR